MLLRLGHTTTHDIYSMAPFSAFLFPSNNGHNLSPCFWTFCSFSLRSIFQRFVFGVLWCHCGWRESESCQIGWVHILRKVVTKWWGAFRIFLFDLPVHGQWDMLWQAIEVLCVWCLFGSFLPMLRFSGRQHTQFSTNCGRKDYDLYWDLACDLAQQITNLTSMYLNWYLGFRRNIIMFPKNFICGFHYKQTRSFSKPYRF